LEICENYKHIHKIRRGKYYTNLVGTSAPANLCISNALEWAFKVCIEKHIDKYSNIVKRRNTNVINYNPTANNNIHTG
jgi:hypothetical protein